jgi:hypothetical protein
MVSKPMPDQYFSFLLRIWCTGSQDHPVWRVMLEEPHTREVVGFDNMDAFLRHLEKLAEIPPYDPVDEEMIGKKTKKEMFDE